MSDDKRLERIEDKLDKISVTLTEHSVILARHGTLHEANHKSLEHHILRTDLLEQSLKPLKQTDTVLRASIKGIVLFGTLLTIAYTFYKLHKGI